MRFRSFVPIAIVGVVVACGETASVDPPADTPSGDAGGSADGSTSSSSEGGTDASTTDGDGGTPPNDVLGPNRDRLLATYLAFLKANASTTQSNGLSGASVATVCDLWTKLDASARATFLTITHRLQGGKLGVDGSSMLAHVVTLYRVSGGEDAQTDPPGSCGGGEFNRLMMSMDAKLHGALVAANDHQGATQSNGKPDLSDISQSNAFWRQSQDLAGPHDPFDTSDETAAGAPRGQVQFFRDPASSEAKAPLGRLDLENVTDAYALEIDHDFDCFHASNPLCDYVSYGPSCFPEASKSGVDIYTQNYGDFDPTWKPTGCN